MYGVTTLANKSRLRWIERALLLVAVVCLGTFAWAWLDATYTQYRENRILDESLAANGASGTPRAAAPASETDSLEGFHQADATASEPPRQPLEQGALVGRIEIPRIGVSSIVLEGVDDQTLRRGVGH